MASPRECDNALGCALWMEINFKISVRRKPDYKVYATVLHNRLKPLLDSLIAPDQTGYVPGRFIMDNVLSLDLVNHWDPQAIIFLYERLTEVCLFIAKK